jgi:hypothetical protein
MRLNLLPWLLCSVLAACAPARIITPVVKAADRRPAMIINEAPTTRSRAESVSHTQTALGSYYRRVWHDEFERMLRPLRTTGLISTLPASMTGPTLARWQNTLNDTWKLTDPGDVKIATDAVLAEAAPMRDQVKAWVHGQNEAPAAIAAAIGIEAILSEIVQEAELLLLRDSGSVPDFEAFIGRYPLGPYTASVLYALGAMHEERREIAEAKDAWGRMIERFPTHPFAGEARERLGAL